MMKRIIFIITLLFCFSMLFAACGNKESVNHVFTNSESAAGPVSPQIVFRDSIEDPQAKSLGELGDAEATGTAKLDLILYETAPNVYEGRGILTRTLALPDHAVSIQQEYVYRTGWIRVEAGREESVTFLCGMTEDRDSDTLMGEEAPIRTVSHKEATLLQKDIPFLLEVEGEKATLSIKLHDQANLVFTGRLTEGAVETSAPKTPQRESVIYINSLDNGGDNAAILIGKYHTNKNSFSGQLCIMGNGTAFKNIDEKVTFSFEPFNPASYQSAGGMLTDRFAKMGVLHTGSGDFILLSDGEQVILECVGKNLVFCGKLFSDTEAVRLQNEADKTKQMLTSLFRPKNTTATDYSQFEGLDPNDPDDMEQLMKMSEELAETMGAENSVPAWYPDGLIPTVNFSAYDGYLTAPVIDQQIFKLYNTQYFENENFADLVSPYRQALSSYDHYKEYLDADHGEGVFLFTMGRYSIQVYLQQSSLKLTSVDVLIY